MKIDLSPKFDYDDVLIKPKASEISSRADVDLTVSYLGKYSRRIITGFPVIVANMTTVGTMAMATELAAHEFFTCLHKFYNRDQLKSFWQTPASSHSFYTLGTSDEDFNKLNDVYRALKFQEPIGFEKRKIDKICLDVANGYLSAFLDKVKLLRDRYPNAMIMAGNVCTPEGVENIIKAGADIVKAGIANGGFCETKNKTGIGYKQFSVALECSQAANELGGLCCSDGGCKSPSDICKGLAAGSHFIMAGSLFGGYDQCEGDWEFINGEKKRLLMYGMSSKLANDKFCGGMKNYRSDEGRVGWVDYKGEVKQLLFDIKGSVSSCCTYTNTKSLQNLSQNCTFTI